MACAAGHHRFLDVQSFQLSFIMITLIFIFSNTLMKAYTEFFLLSERIISSKNGVLIYAYHLLFGLVPVYMDSLHSNTAEGLHEYITT